jgi:hypothetical protein
MNTTHAIASIVFFKITNSIARNTIISDLLNQCHDEKYDIFWHGKPGKGGTKAVIGLLGQIVTLDAKRNHIVHWHTNQHLASIKGHARRWEDLRPAFWWARGEQSPISTEELNKFIEHAEFVEKMLHAFWSFLRYRDKFIATEGPAWSQVFEQPVPYPPSADHPLALKRKA